MNDIVPQEVIEVKIRMIRGHRVILDSDIAGLYEVETRTLNQAVNRNSERFPDDFMFQLSDEEFADLRSQSVMSSWGGRRHPPYAFTEQGVAMLSSVLRSERAAEVNIAIMRTFVHLRQILATHEELRQKIEEMEEKYDAQFQKVFEVIKQLLENPELETRVEGFRPDPDE